MPVDGLMAQSWLQIALKVSFAAAIAAFVAAIVYRVLTVLMRPSAPGVTQDADEYEPARPEPGAEHQAKLASQQQVVDDLLRFRDKIQSQLVGNAVITAQYYIDVAKGLVGQRSERAGERAWPKANTPEEIENQAKERARLAEDELNSLVVSIITRCGPESANAFQASQKAWRTWTEAETAWETKVWEGGSLHAMMAATKRESMTRDRIATVQASDGIVDKRDEQNYSGKNAPHILLEHMQPGTTITRIRELLGMPHYGTTNRWYYRYQDIQLEVAFEGESVEKVIVAACQNGAYEGQADIFGKFVFGKLNLADVLAYDSRAKIQHRDDAKTNELFVTLRLREGPHLSNVSFGALMPHGEAGKLLATRFQWDDAKQVLVSDPKQVLVNWIGYSHANADAPYFSWHIR